MAGGKFADSMRLPKDMSRIAISRAGVPASASGRYAELPAAVILKDRNVVYLVIGPRIQRDATPFMKAKSVDPRMR
jgi:hypothetical protein